VFYLAILPHLIASAKQKTKQKNLPLNGSLCFLLIFSCFNYWENIDLKKEKKNKTEKKKK